MAESLKDILDKLRGGWHLLYEHWQETSEVWNDPMSQRFEKEFWRGEGQKIQKNNLISYFP